MALASTKRARSDFSLASVLNSAGAPAGPARDLSAAQDMQQSPAGTALSSEEAALMAENATLRRQLQEARSENSELQRRQELSVAQIKAHTELLSRLLDTVLVLDMDGVINYVSPACFSMLGYAKKDMLGRTLQDLLTEASRAQFVQATRDRLLTQSQRALAPAEQESVLELRRKDGRVVTVDARGQAWQRPNENGVEIVLSLRTRGERPPSHAAQAQQAAAAQAQAQAAAAAAAAAVPGQQRPPPGMDVDRSPYWVQNHSGLSPLMGDVRISASPVMRPGAAAADANLSALVNVAAGEQRQPPVTREQMSAGAETHRRFMQ